MKKNTLSLLFSFLLPFLVQAQTEVEMADVWRSNGKIYVVIATLLLVLFGVLAFLFYLDRKISRREKDQKTA